MKSLMPTSLAFCDLDISTELRIEPVNHYTQLMAGASFFHRVGRRLISHLSKSLQILVIRNLSRIKATLFLLCLHLSCENLGNILMELEDQI